MVGLRDHASVLHGVCVIVLGAAQLRRREALAKLESFHRRNAEEGRRQAVLHPVKHRIAEAHGKSRDHTLDHAANAV